MSVRHVSMDELDGQGRVAELSVDHAQLLAGTKLVDLRPLGGSSYLMMPNGRVGAVSFDDLQVEVTPKHKLGVTNLMFMLGYASRPGFLPESVTASRDGELWPAMAHSLIASVDRALAVGVLQGYRTAQEALLTVRGRIVFEEQLRRRPGLTVPIEVRYDEFSPDIAENQIVLAAIHVMLGVPRLPSEARRRLLHQAARFAGVTRLARGEALPRWQPNRLNERYHGTLGIAEMLLKNSSARTSRDGVEMSAFVVVMWKVFEDFVTTALTEALATHAGHQRVQLGAYLTGDGDWREGLTGGRPEHAHGDVAMNVDLVHLDWPNVPRVVFDAKYKLASETGEYANAEHYQMLAYCTALGVRVAWLVYAGGGRDIRRRIKHADVEIVAAPLDLSRPPEVLLARIKQIAYSALMDREESEMTSQ
jgi:5-methylcytosine-specific restriction enzyme subunit McrC